MTAGPSVLVVDDEAYVRDSLSEVLAADGWRTHTAPGAKEAVEFLVERRVDVIVSDLRMPEGDGFHLLEHARAGSVEIPIIVITGVGTVAEAVQAMKAGAFDFLQKPVDPEELCLLARRAADHKKLLHEVAELRATVDGLRAPRRLVGSSSRLARVREAIEKVAPTDATVLVRGESGTGKELVAEEVHRRSLRSGGPFRRVHCAAASDEALEKELFAAEAGAFADAEGGTLVLDEVGVLSASMQSKLLHVLEAGEARGFGSSRGPDVRVVAITNEDLASRVKSGAFRSDLFFRLDVFPIDVPPLRDHREDIPEIVEHLLRWARGQRPGTSAPEEALRLTEEALEVLGSYGWPGNVRELRNVLERAAIVAGDREIDAQLVRSILESALWTPLPAVTREFHLRKNLDAVEREIVLRALAHAGGKKKDASALLGIDPRNFGYYMRKHKIVEDKGKGAAEA